jgi:hypothetical protein
MPDVVARLPASLAQAFVDEGEVEWVFGTRSPGTLGVIVEVVGLAADTATVAVSAAALPTVIRKLVAWIVDGHFESESKGIATVKVQNGRFTVQAEGDAELILDLVEMLAHRNPHTTDEWHGGP